MFPGPCLSHQAFVLPGAGHFVAGQLAAGFGSCSRKDCTDADVGGASLRAA